MTYLVTFQSVVVNTTGTIELCFETQEVVSDNETNLVVPSLKQDSRSTTVIHKDSMFNDNIYDYSLGEFKKIMSVDYGLFFYYRRYVLGEATNDKAKAECFAAVNNILNLPYNRAKANGYYLNDTGQLCKKDELGNELFVDYVRLQQTNTTTSGYAQKYPDRKNNYPIPRHRLPTTIKPVVITRPKMTVDEWLDTPLEDLLDDKDRARIKEARAKREQYHIDNGLRFVAMRDQKLSNKKRLEAWRKQKQEQADIEAKYGIQLSLI